MSQKSPITIALVGNPNSGKTSLFNRLTGLNQKVGNFPGVTVDKKTGLCKLKSGESRIIDLPGSYSIYPKSVEERIVLNLLNNPKDPEYPDIIVVIADATNLKRNLLLFTQVHDLGIPTILALNMADLIRKKKKKIEKELLQSRLGVDVVMINARDGEGIEELKEAIENISCSTKPYMEVEKPTKEIISGVPVKIQKKNDYAFVQLLHHFDTDSSLSEQEKGEIRKLIESAGFDTRMEQRQETLKRYEFLDEVLEGVVHSEDYSIEKERASKSTRFDTLFTHKIWGYGVFLLLLFLIFQAIFKWSELPMDLIDGFFSGISNTLITNLPEGKLTSLLADGVIPGIAGILIFIPQIALLFTFIALLEESGYMARVVFIMDRLMRKVGLNGRSIVPLISGVACAVPAIMATRTIDSYKDRIITIMVTPLMSCSARLPVYTILIALVIPSTTFAGIINIQGLVLFALYFAGFFAAIVASYIFKKIIKTKEPSYLVMEMPNYRWPRWKNVLITIVEKVKTFISEAGKIILAISIVLWVLSSYGPGEKFDNAEEIVKTEYADQLLDEKELENKISAYKLEHSYAGYFGKAIEPAIRPLGFDWKIGIALISSFAAREVFVGTMATIYSIGGTDDELTIRNRMAAEINPSTGKPMFNLPVGLSLMIFYAFAMQCMSTLAVVYRETKGWKWPIIQLLYMSGLAYISSLLIFQLMS